jgi:hypothetical protein
MRARLTLHPTVNQKGVKPTSDLDLAMPLPSYWLTGHPELWVSVMEMMMETMAMMGEMMAETEMRGAGTRA